MESCLRLTGVSGGLTATAEQTQMFLFVKRKKEIKKKVHQHRPKVSTNASGRVYVICCASPELFNVTSLEKYYDT